jgi:hypothetical protein
MRQASKRHQTPTRPQAVLLGGCAGKGFRSAACFRRFPRLRAGGHSAHLLSLLPFQEADFRGVIICFALAIDASCLLSCRALLEKRIGITLKFRRPAVSENVG